MVNLSKAVILNIKSHYNDDFYSCKKQDGFNCVTYLSREEAVEKSVDNTIIGYTKYRPGSTGLYNYDGEINDDKLPILMEALNNHKGPIWSGVLSFLPEYAQGRLETPEDAYKLMIENFPNMFKKLGLLTDNVNTFISLHKNTLHPHIHFIFWEEEKLKVNGKGEHCFSSAIFSKSQLVKAHDYIIDSLEKKPFVKELIESRGRCIAGISRLSKEMELLDDFMITEKQLSKDHSWNYMELEPKDKKIINELTKHFFDWNYSNNSPYIQFSYNAFERAKQELKYHNYPPERANKELTAHYNNHMADLHKRCGNKILKFMKTIKEDMCKNELKNYFKGRDILNKKTITKVDVKRGKWEERRKEVHKTNDACCKLFETLVKGFKGILQEIAYNDENKGNAKRHYWHEELDDTLEYEGYYLSDNYYYNLMKKKREREMEQ